MSLSRGNESTTNCSTGAAAAVPGQVTPHPIWGSTASLSGTSSRTAFKGSDTRTAEMRLNASRGPHFDYSCLETTSRQVDSYSNNLSRRVTIGFRPLDAVGREVPCQFRYFWYTRARLSSAHAGLLGVLSWVSTSAYPAPHDCTD
ncbi:hypothetical protein B0H11DRAFT_1908240 [Mycena galericulata]|nr:hypothetical protein B0H11DRAFT_1908240 [Mycena galericulata]